MTRGPHTASAVIDQQQAGSKRMHLAHLMMVSATGLYTFTDHDAHKAPESFYIAADVLVPVPAPPGTYTVSVSPVGASPVAGTTLYISTWEKTP